MELTVEVVGEGDRELDLDDDATYGDVVRAVGLSTQEATALVDGTPVPEDVRVDADRVTVLRLIQGGEGRSGRRNHRNLSSRSTAAARASPRRGRSW